MEKFSDDAIILQTQPMGERDLLLGLLSENHGRIMGVAKFGATSKKRPIFQPLNKIKFTASARTTTQIFCFEAEILIPYFSILMDNSLGLLTLQSANELCQAYLPEKEKNTIIYNDLCELYGYVTSSSYIAQYAIFELQLLQNCGYGLNLQQCVATGARDNLIYISPKSGCAVSAAAGEPYKHKLFKMPSFYINQSTPSLEEIKSALQINEYFIKKFISDEYGKKIPKTRERLMAKINSLNL